MIPARELKNETVFTWSDPDSGQEVTFAVERLEKAAEELIPAVQIPVEEAHAQHCLEMRGIEQHRLDRLTPEALKRPILLVEMPGETHLMIDGHHRYVYARSIGQDWIWARLLPPGLWQQYLVSDMPTFGVDRLTTMDSGIS